jgi:hypothetical protein
VLEGVTTSHDSRSEAGVGPGVIFCLRRMIQNHTSEDRRRVGRSKA